MEVGPVFVVKMIEGFSVGDLVTDENSVESGHILQVKANKDWLTEALGWGSV